MPKHYDATTKSAVLAEATVGKEPLAHIARRHGVAPRTALDWWRKLNAAGGEPEPELLPAPHYADHALLIFQAKLAELLMVLVDEEIAQVRVCASRDWLMRQSGRDLAELNQSRIAWMNQAIKLMRALTQPEPTEQATRSKQAPTGCVYPDWYTKYSGMHGGGCNHCPSSSKCQAPGSG